jgi:hypothetical protein
MPSRRRLRLPVELMGPFTGTALSRCTLRIRTGCASYQHQQRDRTAHCHGSRATSRLNHAAEAILFARLGQAERSQLGYRAGARSQHVSTL